MARLRCAQEQSLVVELTLAIPGTHNSGKSFFFFLEVTQMALWLSEHQDLSAKSTRAKSQLFMVIVSVLRSWRPEDVCWSPSLV